MTERRCPVQTSAVYLVGSAPAFPSIPPPSPPSPVTPEASGLCSPIEELSLDSNNHQQQQPTSAPASPVLTPSETTTESSSELDVRLATAVHVLHTEATALRNLAALYATDPPARDALSRAVELVAAASAAGGKLVLVGVGKSGHIARKLAATFNSLELRASFLHPTEALHGDLGHVGARDVLLMITYSGRTPELLALLPHLDRLALPLLLLTSSPDAEIARRQPDAVVLPAPVHEPEARSFGLAAPTTSTTAALAVGDALAMAASREVHDARVAHVFARNHPGGAIGAAIAQKKHSTAVGELSVPWADVPLLNAGRAATGAEALRVAVGGCTAGGCWARCPDGAVLVPGRLRRLGAAELAVEVGAIEGLVVSRGTATAVRVDEVVGDVVRRLARREEQDDDDEDGKVGEVLLVVDEYGRETVGVLEMATLLQHHEGQSD
ncbi:uncharacterized protein E0L32_002238 [Thyridium curvatum]|uniref:SIS domain-containing protein n=1 Tax=Thyridium curvatum TaxID=1093900 RepID=A0A507AEG1_9PEZI|nr:uncharacterized protein E0L32_002238 [Thyridium curvatum]TPX06742.1 hypothetical protein E0L32_002238 [Thyridium curvatum]